MANKQIRPPTDLRRRRAQGERIALGLVIFTLVVIGGGLIAWTMGPTYLLAALPCLLGGAGVILFIWLLLTGIEWWQNRQEERILNQRKKANDDSPAH
jgi:hypothetical protein